MKYMLMLVGDETVDQGLSEAEMDAVVAKHVVFMDGLRAAGKMLGGERLRFSSEARTIRDGVVLDGPYAETKEQFGGFYLIEAESREEAVECAKRLPLREDGGVEVRPCRTGAQWAGETNGNSKYLVLFVSDRDRTMSREEVFYAIDNHYELSIELAASGRFVGSRSLEAPAAAATVRLRDGIHVVTDGPFAETKEFAAGYFVISCDSIDEAVAWARKLTAGSPVCEVRPIWS